MQKLNSSSIIAIGKKKNKAINNSKPLATIKKTKFF
jgi:hypothetical protein